MCVVLSAFFMLINIAETLKGHFNWPSLCGPNELLLRKAENKVRQAMKIHLTGLLTFSARL